MRKLLLNDKTSYAVKTVSVNAGMVGKKKIMAVLLAVCMVFAYMPMASAANAESGEAGSGEKVACDTGQISIYDLDLPDDSEALQNEDILLEKYMMKKTAEEVSDTSVRSGMKKSAAKGVNAKADSTDCLSTNSKRVYNNLKKKVKNIAEGKATSSMISIESVTSASDAKEDVPVVRSDYSIAEYNSFISGGRMDLDAFLELNNIDLELVVKALLADIPFELYWFDKVSGYSYSLGTNLTAQTIEYDNAGNPAKKRLNNVDLNIRMKVSSDYSSSGTTGTFYVNADKVNRAKNAAAIAASWVSEANSKYTKAYQKLMFYKKKICEAVSYNKNSGSANYGDIWQMINVFDGNAGTNVVCEGYAKAFRYLCDCSGIECLLVTGMMTGGTGAGSHMWNVVSLDGNNYLVDVTNCDSGTIGEPNKLFLKGRSGNQTATNIYEIAGKWGSGTTAISFRYDDDTKLLNSPFNNPNSIDAKLRLADSDYNGAGYAEAVTAEMQDFAKAELDNVALGNYSGSELAKARQLIQNTKNEIATADSIEEINDLVKQFKSAMSQIKTTSQVNAEQEAASQEAAETEAREKAKAAAEAKKEAFRKAVLNAAGKRVSSFKVKAKKKRKAVITWTPVSGVTGYEIMYATNTRFTNAKKVIISGAATKKYTIKKLKAKKKYFIGIRPYTIVKYSSSYSVRQPGKWGNAKKFRAKK